MEKRLQEEDRYGRDEAIRVYVWILELEAKQDVLMKPHDFTILSVSSWRKRDPVVQNLALEPQVFWSIWRHEKLLELGWGYRGGGSSQTNGECCWRTGPGSYGRFYRHLGQCHFFKAPNLGRTSKVCRKVEDLLGSGFSGGFRNFDFLEVAIGRFKAWLWQFWYDWKKLMFYIVLVEVAKQASSEELGRAVGHLETDSFFLRAWKVDSLM